MVPPKAAGRCRREAATALPCLQGVEGNWVKGMRLRKARASRRRGAFRRPEEEGGRQAKRARTEKNHHAHPRPPTAGGMKKRGMRATRADRPLSRRGGGKPTEEGKPRHGGEEDANAAKRVRGRDKGKPRPKGRGDRCRALRAPAFRGHWGGGAPSGERGASAPNMRRM